MATPTGAYISINELVQTWLFKRGKTIHGFAKCLAFAAEAVRVLSTHSLQMVNHKLLEREPENAWWELPDDFLDWVSVGVRHGEYWRPIGVTRGIMPAPSGGSDGPFSTEFSDVFNNESPYVNWVMGEDNPNCGYYWPYLGYPYPYADLFNDWGESKGRLFGVGDGLRVDSVNINVKDGFITCPVDYRETELYLVYVGYGNVDTMTHIPRRAQKVIDAYIDWQWAHVKRGARAESEVLESKYYHELRLFRASNNDLTTTDVKRIVSRGFGQTNGLSS